MNLLQTLDGNLGIYKFNQEMRNVLYMANWGQRMVQVRFPASSTLYSGPIIVKLVGFSFDVTTSDRNMAWELFLAFSIDASSNVVAAPQVLKTGVAPFNKVQYGKDASGQYVCILGTESIWPDHSVVFIDEIICNKSTDALQVIIPVLEEIANTNGYTLNEVSIPLTFALDKISPVRNSVECLSDFFNGLTGTPFRAQTAGTGATVGIPTEQVADQRTGVVQILTGTTATGRCGIATATQTLNLNGTIIFEAEINIPILSTAAQEFDVFTGFINIFTARPTNGVYFRYDRNTSVNFILEAASNGVYTTIISDIPVTTEYNRLRIVISDNAASPKALFFVNDNYINQITTNIPTINLSVAVNIIKSAGTIRRRVYINSIYFAKNNKYTR